MKALVKAEAAPGIWLQDVPNPTIGPDDVLIKISKTAICGTDIHIYDWDGWAQQNVPTPMVIGHEYSGVIVEKGTNVTEVNTGQRVSGEGHIVGHKSRNARAGKFHLDPETKGVGVNLPGAFAEYLALPAFNVVPLPESVPDEIGAILDPLGNAVHTALSYDLVGEDVLITGAGSIGIMAAAVARHAGARNVVLTDINPYRLELAQQVTDIRTVNVREEDLRSVMNELHIVEGFDIGLEMSGTKVAFDQMTDLLMMGGRMALLGLPPEPFETDWSKVILKALQLKGVYGREMFETWYKMLAMLETGLDIKPVITHRFSALDYDEAFKAMKTGKTGKIVLDWDAL